MSGICYIVGAGENYGLDFAAKSGDLVIAADGGLQYLEEAGMTADVVIGDFDSSAYISTQGTVIRLSKEKDHTDTLAAVHEGLGRGYRVFHIYCGTGGRIDHTLANMQTIAFLSQNQATGYLIGRDSVITAITNGSIAFNDRCKGYISIFSHSDTSTGVCVKGLKYELTDAVLSNNEPIGVSNEFMDGDSVVSVGNGTLMVVFPLKADTKHYTFSRTLSSTVRGDCGVWHR